MTPEQERDYREIIRMVDDLTAKCVEHPYTLGTLARVMCVIADDSNAEEMKIDVNGITKAEKCVGDWVVTVKKKEKRRPKK